MQRLEEHITLALNFLTKVSGNVSDMAGASGPGGIQIAVRTNTHVMVVDVRPAAQGGHAANSSGRATESDCSQLRFFSLESGGYSCGPICLEGFEEQRG